MCSTAPTVLSVVQCMPRHPSPAQSSIASISRARTCGRLLSTACSRRQSKVTDINYWLRSNFDRVVHDMTVVYDNFTKRTYSTSEPFDVTPQRHLPEPCAANQQASNKQHNNEDGPFSCLADAALRNDSFGPWTGQSLESQFGDATQCALAPFYFHKLLRATFFGPMSKERALCNVAIH